MKQKHSKNSCEFDENNFELYKRVYCTLLFLSKNLCNWKFNSRIHRKSWEVRIILSFETIILHKTKNSVITYLPLACVS